jgi:hypothetical protein
LICVPLTEAATPAAPGPVGLPSPLVSVSQAVETTAAKATKMINKKVIDFCTVAKFSFKITNINALRSMRA